MTFYLCAISLGASVFFGGGTHSGFLSDAVLQFLHVPLAGLVVANWKRSVRGHIVRSALLFTCGLVLIPLLQLVPLPASFVLAFGGDHSRADVWHLLGQTPAFATVSVDHYATERAVLSLFPSLVLFFGLLNTTTRERRHLSLLLVALAMLSALLGLLQLAGGPASALRPFAFTNPFDPVGFFANRNHLASLLAAGALYALAWLPGRDGAPSPRCSSLIDGLRMPKQAFTWGVVVALLVLTVVLVATRSRAGVVLALLALGVALAAIAPGFEALRRGSSRPLFVALVLVIVLAIAELSAMRLVLRFTTDALSGGRAPLLRATMAAAINYLPFGAGVGTFTDVFPAYVDIRDEVPDSVANRAHSDLAESLLESGIGAAIVLLAFLTWLAWRATHIWRRGRAVRGDATRRVDRNLVRTSVVVVAMLLLHSLVDYPLRTSALAAVMMLAFAFLVPPLDEAEQWTAKPPEI